MKRLLKFSRYVTTKIEDIEPRTAWCRSVIYMEGISSLL